MKQGYGYNKWKDQFERHVKKGEHGITIIAPTPASAWQSGACC